MAQQAWRGRVAGGGDAFSRLLARAGLTSTGATIIGVLVVGWFGARMIGSRTLFLIVYAGVGALVIAFVSGRRGLQMSVNRSKLPTRMRTGQNADVELTMQAKKAVSTIIVQENLHPRLGSSVTIPIPSLRPPDEQAYRYSFKPTVRGVFPVGPLVAQWSDPLGMTKHEQVLADAVDVIVHPVTEQVRDRVLTRMWEDPPVRPPFSKPWPVGFEFYGVRDYVPGDDLRRVVWAILGKTGRMMVRESEQGITDRVVLYLDNGAEWHTPGEISASFETAIRTVASVGVQHLKDGFAVTLLTNDGIALKELRGARAELPFLDVLARMTTTDKTLADGGRVLTDQARLGAHFLVVTPYIDTQSAARIRLIVERGAGVVLVEVVHEESDAVSLSRASSIGCQVVRIPVGASLQSAFAHLTGRGTRN